MIGAGDLHERVAFDSPALVTDGYGGVEDGWTEEFICRAHYRFLRGGETVQAARLSGRQPVVVTVRASSETAAITPAWRMRDTRTGTIYNVRSIVRTEDRRFYELTCESGVAV